MKKHTKTFTYKSNPESGSSFFVPFSLLYFSKVQFRVCVSWCVLCEGLRGVSSFFPVPATVFLTQCLKEIGMMSIGKIYDLFPTP